MPKRGTSNVPMILGIIGGVLMFGSAFCTEYFIAGMVEAGAGGAVEDPLSGLENDVKIIMFSGIVSAILGFISGFFGKSKPVLAGIGLNVAAVLSGISFLTFNLFSVVCLFLFLIGGAIAFGQQKTDV